ncbi:MAG: hypothetical protein ACFCUI_00110 [Bernardetiaceae bacterium]
MPNYPSLPVYSFRLHLLEVLDDRQTGYLRLYRDEVGTNFLAYQIAIEDNRIARHYLIALSQKRLYALRQGDMLPVQAFEDAENGVVYQISTPLDSTQVIMAQAIRLSDFQKNHQIDKRLRLAAHIPQQAIAYLNRRALRYARERDRLILDMRIESKSLAFASKPWFWDRVMSPILTMLRDTLQLDSENSNQKIAFSNFRDNLRAFSFEIRYTNTLFEAAPEFGQVARLLTLFGITQQEQFKKELAHVQNRYLVREYLQLLKVLIQEEARLQLSLAHPVTMEVQYAQIDHKKARKIRQFFDTEFADLEQVEQIEGVFLEINLNRKPAVFKVFDLHKNRTLRGFITPELSKKIARDRIVFGKQGYKLHLLTRYKPETLLHREQWRRFLTYYEERQETDWLSS